MTQPVLLMLVALVSAAGTWLARAYALRRRLVDEPGVRRSHAIATPRGGGAGPVMAIAMAMTLVARASDGLPRAYAAAIALLIVAAIGAWDDHRALPARWRLLVHVGAGVLLALGAFDPSTSPLMFVLAVIAAVVLINVWNFMDGINGIAASQAALVAIAAAWWSQGDAAIIAACIAVACIAFLPFNFPKARVFLGDVGSGALGIALAAAWVGTYRHQPVDALRMLLPLSAFLTDAGLTLARRMLRRERWWEAHAQHLYQGLARRYGHARVTMAYAGWTMVAIIAAFPIPSDEPAFMLASVFVWYTAGAVLWWWMQRRLANGRGTNEKDR